MSAAEVCRHASPETDFFKIYLATDAFPGWFIWVRGEVQHTTCHAYMHLFVKYTYIYIRTLGSGVNTFTEKSVRIDLTPIDKVEEVILERLEREVQRES